MWCCWCSSTRLTSLRSIEILHHFYDCLLRYFWESCIVIREKHLDRQTAPLETYFRIVWLHCSRHSFIQRMGLFESSLLYLICQYDLSADVKGLHIGKLRKRAWKCLDKGGDIVDEKMPWFFIPEVLSVRPGLCTDLYFQLCWFVHNLGDTNQEKYVMRLPFLQPIW